jgi:hypothetical protein
MTEHNIRAPAFYFELDAQDDDPFESDEGPWRVSGVAVGEDSILRTDDGTPVLFSGDVLETAAETQEDQPLSVDHPTDEDGQPTYPPPTDETVGKVVKAGYQPGKGLAYEATVHDPEIAKGIQAGTYEVSVHPIWKGFSGQDEATGAYKPEGVRFLDLSVVSHGMDRANEARLGPSRELAAWARETDIGAELTAAAEEDLGDDQQSLISSAVHGTLRAIGMEPAEIDEERIDGETTEAESSTGSDTPTHMDPNTREQYVAFLTANADFDEESVIEMDDDVLEHTYELAAEGAADGSEPSSVLPPSASDPSAAPSAVALTTVQTTMMTATRRR